MALLFNGVLRPKLLNNPFATCSFINLDFYYHIQHNLMIALLYRFNILNLRSLYLFRTLKNMSICFYNYLYILDSSIFEPDFCFKKVYFLESQILNLDLCIATLFCISIPLILSLFIFFHILNSKYFLFYKLFTGQFLFCIMVIMIFILYYRIMIFKF